MCRTKSLAGRAAKPVQLSPVFLVEPAELLAAARREGLEGIIAKRPGSPYESDRRWGRLAEMQGERRAKARLSSNG